MIHYIEYDPETGEGHEIDPFKRLDLVAVVRCRDCESYQPGMYEHFTCEYLHQLAKPDDFCAWGERKQ